MKTGERISIPVIEEEVIIDKQVIKKGIVEITKKINNEDILLEIPLVEEQIKIERIPKNELVEEHPQIRYEGEIMIIPVVKEIVVKKLLLIEEIRVTKNTATRNHIENVKLKKEEINVKRKDL